MPLMSLEQLLRRMLHLFHATIFPANCISIFILFEEMEQG